jgi:hypothetical protein
MTNIIKESLPKRKRFTVVSVQLVYESHECSTVSFKSSSSRVLAVDADKARALIAESLEESSTVIAVFPGYTDPVFIQ